MTRTLTLLRHAKTERGDAEMADRDRELVDRGRADAQAMAAWIAANVEPPDLVLCSTATRAAETWKLVAPSLGGIEAQFRDDLYLAEADALMEIVRGLPDAAGHVLIVGHNAGLEDFANELVGAGNPDDVSAMSAKYPTSGVAVLGFDSELWSAIDVGEARLLHFMTPRRLAGA